MSLNNSPVITSANVLYGSARLLIAPLGTALPTVATTGAITWPAAWKECGATDKGTELQYSPSYTDVKVDESASPIGKILTTEKITISTALAEMTMTNLANAIAATTMTATAPGVGTAGTEEVDLGSGTVKYCMVGLEGVSPKQLPRYIVGYKALASAAVKLAFARTTPGNIPLSLELQADTTKALGQQLCKIVDITAVGS